MKLDISKESASDRPCPDCDTAVPAKHRFCPSCNRYVRGGPMSAKAMAAKSSVPVIAGLAALAVTGYLLVPLLGLIAEGMLWTYALATDETDYKLTGKGLLIGVVVGVLIFGAVFGIVWLAGWGV